MDKILTKITSFHPKFWLTWVGFGLLRILVFLPFGLLMSLGRIIGFFIRKTAKRRVKIARVNLKKCFPEYKDNQIEKLIIDHFSSIGMGIMDFIIAWWWPTKRMEKLLEIEGEENINRALKDGKGVIFYSAHFTSLEVGCRIPKRITAMSAMYRPNENPVIQKFLVKNRERYLEKTIPRDNVRMMLKVLQKNKVVWFAPDQNYGLKNSVFAKFFKIPAATNIATSRFAEITGAKVVPFVVLRKKKGGYKMIIEPSLDNFPSTDVEFDANRLNQLIENWVLLAPEQYNWMHRRFKDRPENEMSFYQ